MNQRGIGTGAIVGIVVGVVVAVVIGVLGLYLLTKGSGVSDGGTLSIASFASEVDENASSYLSLYISSYGITGKTLTCNATVNFIGPSGGELTGAKICMYAWSAGANSVNAKVLVYGGILWLPSSTIGSDSESLPAMSQANSSHSVTLSFNIS